ncbi:LEAF RUST 10 DISEASE-RESISTANCE LOCUS RECEPTOR-LIKE PROTEIN KINASE-like 1.1 [Nicotiana tabacum]|uniref:LEAF RUST 10 DISEASE-RESISTANCE LOCUS RECEPTOR-LIKE PROTEIN KINASE-like 1.1 n=2 Tax=Nicotiana TaxID=4085 RepID=A0A1S4C449_TOBAC|nr:PREDICTED: probable serine/threonine-protein kinase At1g18390 [Nicotiana sylvestris]XP_016495844.1 PREDICTED: LEAF RUST 10 DISEASE-RESISTANCE LOCUS RECEPTOR-LIKE PROTEIN KINASE-like 1.1 [Nicotiana tabacum]
MLALDYLSVFLIFYQFLIFHSNQAQNQSRDSCPEEFNCGILGNVRFPFSASSQPACGLYIIDCDAKPNPTIPLGGNVYTALQQRSYKNSYRVLDLRFNDLLARNSCNSFDKDLSFPSSPSISFRTNERNITLFKCNNSLDIDRSTNDYYFRDYKHYTNCSGFSIYYKYPTTWREGYSDAPEGDIPNNCSLIQLPIKWRSQQLTQNSSLFDLLTANFTIQWSLSDDCSKCYYQGGRCLADSNNNFLCSQNPKARRKSKRILVIVLSAVIGLILSICLSIFIWRFKKGKGGCSYFFTRNTYSDSSSQDLEGCSKYFGVPVFSYSTLEEATNNFDSSKELGDGGFGTVYHGKLRDGREVAVKRLYEQSSKRMVQFKNEVEILTRLRHQNLVMLYGCTSRHSRELLLVYEYIPNGTIADHLHGEKAKNGSSLIWPIRMKIAIETASALAYLHASDIIHRDVKTTNILLDNNFGVKVADFGLSRLSPHDVTHISTAPQGTPGYVDPEYHACYQLTNKSDVYSFGVVLVELISSLPAVDIRRHKDEISLANFALNKILKCAFEELIDPSLGYESDAEVRRMTTSVADLAFQCLQLEKEMRPTMDQVLEILKAIRRGEFESQKKEEINVIDNVDESEDDVQLMKSTLHLSPNSVNDRWVSESTTASISG